MAEGDELAPLRRGAPPRQADRAHRRRLLERHDVDILPITALDRYGELGENGAAVAVGDHLHHRGEAGGAKVVQLAGAGDVADCRRLVAQTMTLLKQQEVLAAEIGLRHAGASAERVTRRQGESDRVVERRSSSVSSSCSGSARTN